MRINKLTYINHNTGWNVRDMSIDQLTLLVGASGVGKTQILRALLDIARIAKGTSYNGVEWNVSFQIDKSKYEWNGRFESVVEDDVSYFDKGEKSYSIVHEKLFVNGKPIFERNNSKIFFNGKETVKLDVSKSAIELLKEEELIAPIYKGFAQIYRLNNENRAIRISSHVSENRDQIKDIATVHDSKLLSPIEKLFVLRKNGLNAFSTIVNLFKEIFPLVEDVDFSNERFFDGTFVPILKIKEKGVDAWILQHEISSGMFRALSQITILTLAQDGDVVLIDEFENGLGVNCIDKLASQILDSESDIQIIMTSHHPYIINCIPFKKWKIVTRNESNVRILKASDLNIGEHSKHEAFLQLIQTKEFKTGRQ
ncbi:AAA family ATPase [Fibrobacter intestinalis]|uniref:Predicted ATPase n=1 Tax=Fibrobacter intestinalis TaxID=28122 RepID=A0A1T4RBP9_9BACT|nr:MULTISPECIES: ATP-binding protein [Fibrobacter]PBC73873.1 putative ATPase [Fibrobacter sp. NR9]SKA13492.1 Predicted ATPase [Fibrobacter intestinalis]